MEPTLPHGHGEAVQGLMGKLGMDKRLSSRPSRQRDGVMAMIARRVLVPWAPRGTRPTVEDQVNKRRKRFGLSRVVLVGARGMLTQARIQAEVNRRTNPPA